MTAPIAELLTDWRQLWAAAGAAACDGSDPRYVFESIGLRIQPRNDPLPLAYEATPRGSVTFASTGGDSVQFSGVADPSGLAIVMTVPMQFDRPNLVLGATLHEFLELGSRHRYFGLEQLADSFGRTAGDLADPSPWLEDDQTRCLALLRERLDLNPWPHPRERLDELQSRLPVT